MTINDREHYQKLLYEELRKESDRGAVMVEAAFLDRALENTLKARFVPTTSEKDASISNLHFAVKINLAYRVGLISSKFRDDLLKIKDIRNDFAHDIEGCDFNNPKHVEAIKKLAISADLVSCDPGTGEPFKDGPRGDFRVIVSCMLWVLRSLAEGIRTMESCPIKAIEEAFPEWFYTGNKN